MCFLKYIKNVIPTTTTKISAAAIKIVKMNLGDGSSLTSQMSPCARRREKIIGDAKKTSFMEGFLARGLLGFLLFL